MKKNRDRTSLATKIFILGWGIYLISYTFLKQSELMYMYDTSRIFQYLKVILTVIFSIKMIFIDKYSRNKITLYFAIISLMFLNSILIDNNTLFFSTLIALSAGNIDFKRFIKFDIKARTLILLSIIGASLLGYLPNYTRLINGSVKQAFGFTHPNILCFYAITILLELMYLVKKNSLKYIIVNCAAIYALTYFCFSKTSIYSFILIFMINIIIKNKEKLFNKKIARLLAITLPLVLTLLSVITIIGYGQGNEVSKKIDIATTERIRAGYRFYETYGIKLFGNKIETVGTRMALYTNQKINIFDMGYLRLLVNYGAITAAITIVLLCALQADIIRRKEYKLLLISTFFIITGFAENNVYNIIMNFTLIYIPFMFEIPNNKLTQKRA